MSVLICAGDAVAQPDRNCTLLAQQYWESADRALAERLARDLSAPCHRVFVESIVQRLPSVARSRDAASLHHIALDAQRYLDASLAYGGLELFADGSATDEARWFGLVQAARHFRFALYLRPDLVAQQRDVPGETEVPRIGQCTTKRWTGEIRLTPTGAAFDTLYADRLREVNRRPGTSSFLRGMIKCLSSQYGLITPAVQPGEITARYDCDNRWFLRYTGPEDEVIVAYGPATAPGTIGIALWGTQRERSEYLPFAADLRVLSRGNTVLVVPHGHISCRSKMLRDRGEPIAPGLDTLSNWQWRSQPDSTRRPAPPRRTRPPGR